MTTGPLDRLESMFPPEVREIMARSTPIPTIAQRAARICQDDPTLVRADIGQVSGLMPEIEVLYGPPTGLDALRKAVAELWTRTFALDTVPEVGALDARNVAITTGAAEALTLLMRCFGQGRTVGLPKGFWENYVNAVSLASGKAVALDYFDRSGALDVDGLARQIEAHRPSVLIVNFPANPTGAVLVESEARALADLARRFDLVLVSDEVYARLRYDGQPPLTLLTYAPERVVVVSSASKEYLLPGARVGYVISARPELTDEALRKLVRANSACPNVPGQRLLLPLVETDLADLRAGRQPSFLSRIRDEMRSRKESLVVVLKKHGFALAGRSGHDPMGTIFLMAELPAWWPGNDAEFVEEALERHCVSAIPGSAFGLEGTIRFSFGGMTQAAIAQLDRNLEAWRAGR